MKLTKQQFGNQLSPIAILEKQDLENKIKEQIFNLQ